MLRNDNGEFICKFCFAKLTRNDKHDAYYCDKCDEWCEGTCGEDECEYCFNRPKRPSEVTKINETKNIIRSY